MDRSPKGGGFGFCPGKQQGFQVDRCSGMCLYFIQEVTPGALRFHRTFAQPRVGLP